MSMRSYANYAYVVKEEFVKSIAPDEFRILENTIEENDIDWGCFAQEMMWGDYVDADENIINTYDNLCKAFNKKTKLSLEIAYMDEEVDTDLEYGHFWTVGGVTETTEAGKKYTNEITYESYVVFG